MAKIRRGEKAFDEVFESWDYHMFEKIEQLDRMVARAMTEAGLAGVPSRMAIIYMRERLTDMIDQVAEKREREYSGARKG